MKLSFCIMCVLLVHLACGAQARVPIAQTFRKSDGLGSIKLFLYNDSSFFMAYSDCTHADIARGRWVRKRNNLKLLPDTTESDCIKAQVTTVPALNDSLQTFTVKDYFNKPVPGHNIMLFDNRGMQSEFWTDSNGEITVKKGKFVSWFTGYELSAFDFKKDLTSSAHAYSASENIMLRYSYPLEVLRERPRVKAFKYSGGEYVYEGKLLRSKQKALTLESD